MKACKEERQKGREAQLSINCHFIPYSNPYKIDHHIYIYIYMNHLILLMSPLIFNKAKKREGGGGS